MAPLHDLRRLSSTVECLHRSPKNVILVGNLFFFFFTINQGAEGVR